MKNSNRFLRELFPQKSIYDLLTKFTFLLYFLENSVLLDGSRLSHLDG